MRESGGRGWGGDWSTEPEVEEAETAEEEAEEARAGRGGEVLEGPSLMTEPTRRPSVTGSTPGTTSGSMARLDLGRQSEPLLKTYRVIRLGYFQGLFMVVSFEYYRLYSREYCPTLTGHLQVTYRSLTEGFCMGRRLGVCVVIAVVVTMALSWAAVMVPVQL